MTTPNTTVTQPQHDAQSTSQVTATTMAKQTSSSTTSSEQTQNIVSDIGEYLMQAAQNWAKMTDALVESRQVQQAVEDAHEQAMIINHLSDLSTVVSMDVDLSKLCKIRDLTAQFSQDVHQVWQKDTRYNQNSS
ncbi:unnamed protein product [Fusarium graminearum]|uniref:Chromosome 3, complete genome n=3 Tax=Gibberella zeae TaxID=5518 RepID=A0A1C3YJU3_GIBZE|nr:unnamed protein product [Fusarium graminearum]CAF3534305.1 unnamed protein product [Fusarium graminearum]CAF3579473.1 unnamed protein product [Fusarium graminearum]CAG1963727.1 unnamed protein product [Fusarium graminearum]CAG1983400.1 unnamed protein product [Fusarium graminearum]